MNDYWLSAEAEEDYQNIVTYGVRQFGIDRTDRYADMLIGQFTVLAEDPYRYPAIDHILPGYRRSVCGVHSIYYRIMDNGVEIVRIVNHQNFPLR